MKKIKLFTNKRTIWRLVKNISYAKGNGATCEVYMKDGQHYHCAMSIAKLVVVFAGFGLFIIHRKTLVNVHEIPKELLYNPLLVTMKDGSKHAVSFRKQRSFIRLKIKGWIDLLR